MTALFKSTKLNEVEKFLGSLTRGKYRVNDLIDTILQTGNFKSKTLVKICPSGIPESYENETPLIAFEDLWVDMEYQRLIQLYTLLKYLKEKGGFQKTPAGTIDYAERCDGDKFVWDGLGRCLQSGMTGMTGLPYSATKHPEGTTHREAQKEEANWFETKNGFGRKPSAEAIFKAQVCQENPDAIEKLKTLKKMKLDVAGLNPSGTSMTGYSLFSNWYRKIDEKFFIEASDIIRTTWYEEKKVYLYGLVALSFVLSENERLGINEYSIPDIKHAYKKWRFNKRNKKERCTQSDLNKLGKRTVNEMGWIICTKVLEEDPKEGKLQSLMKVNEEQAELIMQRIEDAQNEENLLKKKAA